MHIHPSKLCLLSRTNKHWHLLIENHADYWTKMAAHLIWRVKLPSAVTFKHNSLLFAEEGYYAAMKKVVFIIEKEVKIMATIGQPPLDIEQDTPEHRKNTIDYWAQYMESTLEQKARRQILYKNGCDDYRYDLSEEEALTLPMKEIAKRQVINFTALNHNPTDNYDEENAKNLILWARNFASMPGISHQTKRKMALELSSCFDGAIRNGAHVQLNVQDLFQVLQTIFCS